MRYKDYETGARPVWSYADANGYSHCTVCEGRHTAFWCYSCDGATCFQCVRQVLTPDAGTRLRCDICAEEEL